MMEVIRPGSMERLTSVRAFKPPKVRVTSETLRCVIEFSARVVMISVYLQHTPMEKKFKFIK
jgi:hypothetical protein